MMQQSDRGRGLMQRGEDMTRGERTVQAAAPSPFTELNERSREIFRLIVDGYVQTGEPIGSRTLSRLLGQNLSPATIRNVMADLEEAGLLYAPHTSAGRLPTEAGLRLFVHGLLELGNLAEDERHNIESAVRGARQEPGAGAGGGDLGAVRPVALRRRRRRAEAGTAAEAHRVRASRARARAGRARHRGRAWSRTGSSRCRSGCRRRRWSRPPTTSMRGSIGRTIEEARSEIDEEIGSHQAQLDELTSRVVATGHRQLGRRRRRERADRARPGQSARRRDRACRSRAAAGAVRDAGDQGDRAAPARRQQDRPKGCRSLSAPRAICSASPAVR